MSKKAPNRKKMALLFEKRALNTISKLDGYKDLSEANRKKFIKILWKMLNNRAIEIIEGRGITPEQAQIIQAQRQAQTKKKEDEFKLPPSQIPKNVRRGLDALSIYSGAGTAFTLGSKLLPFLLL